jgi:hypothetical protein
MIYLCCLGLHTTYPLWSSWKIRKLPIRIMLAIDVLGNLTYPLMAVGAPVCQPGASQTTTYTIILVYTSDKTVAGFTKDTPGNVIHEVLTGSTTSLAFGTFVLDERK